MTGCRLRICNEGELGCRCAGGLGTCRRLGKWPVNLNQIRRSKIPAFVSAAMRAVIMFFATQARTAEFVLIEPFTHFKTTGLFLPAPRGERRAPNVGSTSPHAPPTRACCTNVVIHLPAGAEVIALICRTDSFDHFAPNGITKVG